MRRGAGRAQTCRASRPTVFELPRDWNNLIGRSAHPGIAVFGFPAYQSHTVYVHDVQWPLHHWPTHRARRRQLPGDWPLRKYAWPLGDQYLDRGPVLGPVILYEREPPVQRDCR